MSYMNKQYYYSRRHPVQNNIVSVCLCTYNRYYNTAFIGICILYNNNNMYIFIYYEPVVARELLQRALRSHRTHALHVRYIRHDN